ncbi:hypothetical protein MXB_2980, partial [Myxobolus squamalis]
CNWTVCILGFCIKLHSSNTVTSFPPAQPAVTLSKISPNSPPKIFYFSLSTAPLILLPLNCIDSSQSFRAI